MTPTVAHGAAPTAPTIGTIVGGNGYLEVPFTGASGATSIEYSVDGGISWNTRFTGISAGSQAVWSPLTIHDLENGKEYSVKLRSRNSSGVAESSATSGTPISRSQIYSNSGFLQGQYVEVGVRPNGAFGSAIASNTTLAGLHMNSNVAGCLGFRVDRQKNGWGSTVGASAPFTNIDDGDFFCPGNPYEGWGLKVGSIATAFNNNGATIGLPGYVQNVLSTTSQQSVEWTSGSNIGGISVLQKAIVPNTGQSLHIDITLTNVSGATVNNIYYVRGFDPDNATGDATGTSSVAQSVNEVMSVGGGSAVAQVKATFASGALIMMRSTDSRARAARNTNSCCTATEAEPIAVYEGTGYWTQSLGAAASSDKQVAISFNIGTLAAGASTTLRVSYVLSADEASSPTVSTGSATGVGPQTTATLNGSVNANNQATNVQFEYGTNSDLSGTTTKVTASGSPVSGTTATSVSALISGLTRGTTYYYRTIATNDTGTSYGAIYSFTPVADPSVSINAPNGLGDTTATLNGTIAPNGGTVASIYFTISDHSDFSTGSVFTQAGSPTVVYAGSLANITTSLTGLSPGGTYYYKLTGTNSSATVTSSSLNFTTTPAPLVTAGSASSVNATLASATLNSRLNVYSVPTGSVYFQLSTNNAFPNGDTSNLSPTPAYFDSGSTYSVTANATSLTVGATYYFRLFASNTNGSNYGTTSSFTLIAAPTVTTGSASTSGTTANLTGSVNANGDSTTSIRFYYATSLASIGSATAYVSSSPTGAIGGSNTSVTGTISGLTAGSTYYYQLRATNSTGTTSGDTGSFTLAAPDITAPTVSISVGSSASKSASFTATITFSEYVTGFTSSDLLLSGSSGGWTKATPSTSDNITYTILLTPTAGTGAGSLILNIPLGATTDTSGNQSTAAPTVAMTIVNTTTVPDAPINVSATVTGNTTATLNFSAPGSNGGATITSYTYTISGGSGGSGTLSTGSTGFPGGDGSGYFSITDLTGGTTYTFSVVATNSNGDSVSASSSPVTTTSPATVPGAPTIGTLTSTGYTTATLTFTAGSNGGSTITSFTATTGSLIFTLNQSGSGTFNLTGLTSGSSYSFTVYATNSVGNSSPSASSNTVTMPTPPTVPGAPTIGTLTTTGTTTATLTFTAPASNGGSTITSYTATSGSLTFTLSQAGSGTFTLTGLTAGSSYSFTVYATNSVGDSSPSAASNTVTMPLGVTVSGAPTITSAVANSDTSVNIYFDAPTSNGGSVITSYTITSSPSGITATLNQSTGGTFTLSSLSPSTTYTFSVIATNSVGDSSASNSISITTLASGLLPILAPAKSNQGGFTSRITNYDANYLWSCTVASSYNCIISSTGEITVTGAINSGTEILIQVTSSKSGSTSKTTNLTGQTIGLGIDKQLVSIEDPIVTVSKGVLTISQGKYQLIVNGWQKYEARPEYIKYEIKLDSKKLFEFVQNENKITQSFKSIDLEEAPEFSMLQEKIKISGLEFSNRIYILEIVIVFSNTALVKRYKIS